MRMFQLKERKMDRMFVHKKACISKQAIECWLKLYKVCVVCGTRSGWRNSGIFYSSFIVTRVPVQCPFISIIAVHYCIALVVFSKLFNHSSMYQNHIITNYCYPQTHTTIIETMYMFHITFITYLLNMSITDSFMSWVCSVKSACLHILHLAH